MGRNELHMNSSYVKTVNYPWIIHWLFMGRNELDMNSSYVETVNYPWITHER